MRRCRLLRRWPNAYYVLAEFVIALGGFLLVWFLLRLAGVIAPLVVGVEPSPLLLNLSRFALLLAPAAAMGIVRSARKHRSES